MRWKRIGVFTAMFAILALVALIAMRPRACDPAVDRCPDENGEISAVGMFEHSPCDEPGMNREIYSCVYLRRRQALKKLANESPPGVFQGIWRSSDEMSSTELALDGDGWVALREASDVGAWGVVVAWNRDQRGWTPDRQHADYLPVRWGPRSYLIATSQLPQFVNEVNRGFYRGGRNATGSQYALPRVSGATDSLLLCGLPRLPVGWQSRIHPTPLVLSIRTIVRDRSPARDKYRAEDDRYVVEIDAGLQAGIFPGMELSPREEHNTYHGMKATIESVYAVRATGTLRVEPIARGASVAAGLELVSGAFEWTIPECVGT
jgi:hypothetical protein